MLRHALNWSSYITLALTAILLGVVYYWIFLDDQKVITFNDEVFPVAQEIYHPGETIKVWIDFCKHQEIEGTSSFQLVNGLVYHYTPNTISAGKGCSAFYLPIEIPDYAEDGLYHVEFITTYDINRLKTVRYENESEEFRVIK